MHDTLISAETLRALTTPVVVLDCRFDLANTGAGEAAHAQGHLPGAHYAHLDRDLSGPRVPGNGRHPLPTRETFAATVARWGITPGVQVVVYDAQAAVYAARAWWMLRWLGHPAVAVLDGGLAAWQAAGGALDTAVPAPATGAPYPLAAEPAMPTLSAAQLQARLGTVTLIDARAADRFRGENETLDPVAGHIPGAVNRFFRGNLGEGDRFRPAAELRAAFEPLLAAGPGEVVHSCGSGVTACHNLLAMTVAGLGGGTLYPGSWSEWCADPARPVERG